MRTATRAIRPTQPTQQKARNLKKATAARGLTAEKDACLIADMKRLATACVNLQIDAFLLSKEIARYCSEMGVTNLHVTALMDLSRLRDPNGLEAFRMQLVSTLRCYGVDMAKESEAEVKA